MSGGFLSGLMSGAVVSGVALASVSLMSPPGSGSIPVTAPVDGGAAPLAQGRTAAPPAEPGVPALVAPEAAPGEAVTDGAAPGDVVTDGAAPAPAPAPADDGAPNLPAAPEGEASAFASRPEDAPAAAEVAAVEPEASAAAGAEGAVALEPATAETARSEPVPPEPAAPAAAPAAAPPAAPEVADVEVPAGSEFNRPRPDVEPLAPAPQPAPAAAPAPDVSRPEAEPAPRLAEIAPPSAPAGDTAMPAAPALPAAAPAAAVAPAAEASVPVPPPGEAAAPALSREAAADAAPAAPTIAVAPAETPAPVAAQPEVRPLAPEPAPAPVAAGTAAPGGEPAEARDEARDAAPVIVDEAPNPPGVARAPKPGFAQSVPGVRVNRLPRIGDPAPAPAATGAAERSPTLLPDVPAAGEEASESAPALQLYAAEFSNPEALPLFALVLGDPDPAEGGLAPAALMAAGLNATIAIDPARDGAAARAAVYRAAGFEVAILMPDLPAGATASDLEVSYQGFARTIPEAVLLMARAGAALQTDRRLARHVVALLASEGRGLISDARGLDQAGQAAAAAGLPHAAITRRIDAAAVASGAMRRLLERAAFEAGQTGAVVIVADGDAVTVSGLAIWAAEVPKNVVLAPVSAVLLGE